MVGWMRPEVLVVDGDAGCRLRIADLLGEAGIDVTAVPDGAAARAAMSRSRFDLAVVGASARLAAAGLGLDIVMADCGEPRRLVGQVRDRLLGAAPDAGEDAGAAEHGIAAAKLACLGERQRAARAAGASDLAASLAREIAETAALSHVPASVPRGRGRDYPEPLIFGAAGALPAARASFSSIIARTFAAPCLRHSRARSAGSSASGA